jgi:hypothetical protein
MAQSAAQVEPTLEIKDQTRFYEDKKFLVFLLALLIGFQCLVLLQLILMLRSTVNPPPVFFPTTASSQLILEAPLDQASIPSNVVLNWVAETLMTVNTFNFVSYPIVMEKAKEHFTKEGYEFYQKALTDAKIIDKLTDQKLVLTATPTDAPQITKEGSLGGRYLWKIKIPMEFHYQSVADNIVDNIDITLLIMRVPTIQSPNGVAILKYDMEFKGV